MKIVFFGTPEFAVTSLKAIIDHNYEVAAVVTAPDRTGGRGNKIIESDVKKFALTNHIPVLQPEKLRDEDFLKNLRSIDADLFVVIAFRMLPKVVWEMPKYGTFNLHASLLPDFRGAAPINHAIICGRKETGVTTFFINEKIDEGGILLSAKTEIKEEDDAGTLHDRLMELGAKLVIQTIDGIENGNLKPRPQHIVSSVSLAPKIFKDNCKIDFHKPALKVNCFVRGLSPYPGSWSVMELEDGRLIEVKVFKTKIVQDEHPIEPGCIQIIKNKLFVGTSTDRLEILELQPAGKRKMTATEFLAGYRPTKFLL